MIGPRIIGIIACLSWAACDVRTLEFTGDAGFQLDATGRIDVGECDPIPEQCNFLDDDCDGETDEDPESGELPGVGEVCGLDEGECETGITICAASEGCAQRGDCVACSGHIPPTAEECDGLDNDCDGETDDEDAFDFCTNPFHCGQCNVTCCNDPEEDDCDAANALDQDVYHAVFTCGACESPVSCPGRPDNGVCTMAACLEGYADCDGDPCNGCECVCGLERPGPEICDGEDNDCDGLVDDADPSLLPAPICRQSGECQGTQAVCVTDPRCATCAGQPDDETCWICDYGPTVELEPDDPCRPAGVELLCDDLDGNCNALTDESFPLKNNECDNGKIGGCRVVGQYACNAMQNGTECSVAGNPGPPPSNEICNGVDDNCNDLTDENQDDPTSTPPTTGVRDSMVLINRGPPAFYMYKYEASRPGATSMEPGAFDHRACSRPNVLPWASVSYDEAEAACAAAGLRLCTEEEWSAACFGAGGDQPGDDFPYGEPYSATACNGKDLNPAGCAIGDDCPVPTGSLATCDSDDQIFDLSGNVKEWTNDCEPAGSCPPAEGYHPRGGAFDNIAGSLSCDFDFTVLPPTLFRHENLGFRCCCTSGPGCPPP